MKYLIHLLNKHKGTIVIFLNGKYILLRGTFSKEEAAKFNSFIQYEKAELLKWQSSSSLVIGVYDILRNNEDPVGPGYGSKSSFSEDLHWFSLHHRGQET